MTYKQNIEFSDCFGTKLHFPARKLHENRASPCRIQFYIDLDGQNQALYGQNRHL